MFIVNHILDITYLRDARLSLKEGNFDDSKWRDLGDQLCLLPDTLKTIKDDYSDDRRRLRETLVKWLEGADGVSPSWGSLVQALKAIEDNAIAEHISESILLLYILTWYILNRMQKDGFEKET